MTVPGGTRARRRGIVVHRSSVPEEQRTTVDRIPVTTPARTIVDLADHSTRRELERAIDEATYLGLDLTSLRPLRAGRGSGLLAEVIRTHERGHHPHPVRLRGARPRRLRRPWITAPLVNQVICGYEVDFVWPEVKLIVETDGWSAHGRRSAFERDRVRDAVLQVAGWRVIRLTWRRLSEEPVGRAPAGALVAWTGGSVGCARWARATTT